MKEFNKPDDVSIHQKNLPDSDQIQSLISDLGSDKKDTCLNAYQVLLAMGEPVVQSLVKALSSPQERIRWQILRLLDAMKPEWTPFANIKTIRSLIEDLGGQNSFARIRARQALVQIDGRAVGPLIQLLSHSEGIKRWEAAKTLSQIADPLALEALIRALEDENFEIRWLAAEGLISMHEVALAPLLRQLIKKPAAVWLREGAHHYLHEIYGAKSSPILKPVLHALESEQASLEVPLAARAALDFLESQQAAR